jgi:hypothetical protein
MPGYRNEPREFDVSGGYLATDTVVHRTRIEGDAHDRYQLLADGTILQGNGSSTPSAVTSGTALGGMLEIEAGAEETVVLANEPTVRIEMSEDLEVTLDGDADVRHYVFIFIQPAAGGATLTWVTPVNWTGGLEPYINAAPNAATFIDIYSEDGGATFHGVGAQVDGNSPLNYGILEAIPYDNALIASAMTSQAVRYTYFTAPTSGSYDTIMTVVGTTAAATITRNEAGIYEVTNPATGALGDRLGTTGHVAAMWATVSIPYETPLTAAVDLVAGQRYALAFLCVATTQPLIMCRNTNSNIQAGAALLHPLMSPKRTAICTAQTELVADASGLTLGFGQTQTVWGALKVAS